MTMFENAYFKGQFRSYQQNILDNSEKYLQDGKIHIVAAPGSGKTVLGLELIVRLREPCLILSPTTTIRNQWGDRFTEHFFHGENPADCVSYNLLSLKPLTSITYQALHAAVRKLTDPENGADYSAFDLVSQIKSYGVKTVCLDEAHHLQNEWQKALEFFLNELQGGVKIIALTATPPYDAPPREWERYISVCGEIDEEICVPELVREGSLCPHQDYVYFNYPTAAETQTLNEYKQRSSSALKELYSSQLLKTAYEKLLTLKRDYEFLYSEPEKLVCLLSLFKSAEIKPDKKLVRMLYPSKILPASTPDSASAALNYLIKSGLLDESESYECLQIFKTRGLCERGELRLGTNEKLKKRLISSAGKLKSIAEIVESETENKRGKLRMLILTDHIKKEEMSLVGSDTTPDAVSIVSVFETVRRTGASVAALSGSLVILPEHCKESLIKASAEFTLSPAGAEGYKIFDFRADNREKVRLVSGLFKNGFFNVLVGTKSLLGEGWDAPCVNSLILASFIGSFMLSNQMRGRAIRTDRDNPDKTANIWHLATIEPPLYGDAVSRIFDLDTNDEINSYDFQTVKRRFDCFVAPDYDTGEIKSGISRVKTIRPPYDKKGVQAMNEATLSRAANDNLAVVWQNAVSNSAHLMQVGSTPKSGKVPPFVFVNIYYATLLLSFSAMLIALFITCASNTIKSLDGNLRIFVAVIAFAIALVLLVRACGIINSKILKHISPQKSITTYSECVLATLKETGLIGSGDLKVDGDAEGTVISITLANASVHDQNVFHTAVGQMLSPIDNPRYLLIPKGIFGYRYRGALACPEIIGAKREYADILAAKLKKSAGNIDAVYTRTERGRRLILKCWNNSYITQNAGTMYEIYRSIPY